MMFDYLEDIVKARKAKGLDHWKKLEHLQDQLQGKNSSHITFTTSYPGQEGSKKQLGSAAGNLHFLLGYVNPGFHVADYHWNLVDPNMSPEEISKRGHPANPRYWKDAGLEITDEGDFDLGKPHAFARKDRKAKARTSTRKTGAVKVVSGYGSYVAVPDEGTVYSLNNGHVYKWDIVKESYFASANPDLDDMMDVEEEDSSTVAVKGLRESFGDKVYPLVKQRFPKPGSIFPVGSLKALVTSDSIEFFDGRLNKASIKVFDRVYESLDLNKGGDVHPSILLKFAKKYLNVITQGFEQYVHYEGPTKGFQGVTGTYERELVVEGDTVRVIPRSVNG